MILLLLIIILRLWTMSIMMTMAVIAVLLVILRMTSTRYKLIWILHLFIIWTWSTAAIWVILLTLTLFASLAAFRTIIISQLLLEDLRMLAKRLVFLLFISFLLLFVWNTWVIAAIIFFQRLRWKRRNIWRPIRLRTMFDCLAGIVHKMRWWYLLLNLFLLIH